MKTQAEAKITILRFDPSRDNQPHPVEYKVPYDCWNGRKIIDVLRYIYENQAPDLAFREPCGHYVCGSCTVMVNKKPSLACSNLAEQEMFVEPLTGHRVIKDLVIEM